MAPEAGIWCLVVVTARPPRERDLTLDQAAHYLGVAQSTLREWDNQGVFKRTWRTPGGHRRFNRAEVESFRAARARPDVEPQTEQVMLLELALRQIEREGVTELSRPAVLALANECDGLAARLREYADRLREEARQDDPS